MTTRSCVRAGVAAVVAVGLTASARAQSPQFRSADEARTWLVREQLGTDPDALLIHLSFDDARSVDVMRAYVALGLPLNTPSKESGLTPLTLVTRSCVGNESAPLTTAVLIAAGADPTVPAPDGDTSTALMEAVNCPLVLQAMLARRPDLAAVDGRGYTVMHHAIASEERDQSARLVREAGFDVATWRPSLTKEFGHLPNLAALLGSASALTVPEPAPRAAVEWTALGPYPARTAAEAARLLARPGSDTSADGHMWDGISQREPQRLALALQAGANPRQLRAGSNYSPLMFVAGDCDDRQPERQLAIAEQLIDAGADVTAVSDNKSNALMVGAGKCAVAMLRAFIAAGVALNGIDTSGNTAMKLAILQGRADVVTLLIEAGVDPRKEPYDTGRLATGNKAVQDALKRRPKR